MHVTAAPVVTPSPVTSKVITAGARRREIEPDCRRRFISAAAATSWRQCLNYYIINVLFSISKDKHYIGMPKMPHH